ncbi:4-hydroxyproline epimerase [Undibacterium macrobrachii]|uniref:Hydroxyproline-2-epimerase n=1 Tax=Undibacterium macrobrachii TaxID=1119058 RepID=A0ABQ2XI40_9BURK|nr:4-hydroxyproline epimerase [Undibacterium macrobrachii]GGX17482.1 hydroxyproline-2-epimerase [Undibacterium macrobrachii]
MLSQANQQVTKIQIIDSHTGGEPTRLIVDGGPDLGDGPLSERVKVFKEKFDQIRSAVVCEPRGSDVLVGALLCKPHDPSCSVGVIFFNNVGYLGMCGHGTIGLVATLAYQGVLQIGRHKVDTPVGAVEVELHPDHSVSVHNVAAYRAQHAVTIEVEDHGPVTGDIAWGGNWFFLIADHGQDMRLANIEALTSFAWRVREALNAAGIRGDNGGEIDHIELFGAPSTTENDSQNFVLCPGKAYDRSPCGTGTSAKLACLAADGKLKAGEIWRQESIIGSVFEASFQAHSESGKIHPTIRGTAFVNAESSLILQDNDPFVYGIR